MCKAPVWVGVGICFFEGREGMGVVKESGGIEDVCRGRVRGSVCVDVRV